MKTYTIRKGCHYSNFFPSFFRNTGIFSMSKTIRFTESCRYEIDEPSCVNKLFGFCFGFGVHRNSVRFGWTYDPNMRCIVIWQYVYSGKKLSKEKVFKCEIGEEHTYSILLNGSDATLYVNGHIVWSSNVFADSSFITTLGPYFGGNSRAPHCITIEEI